MPVDALLASGRSHPWFRKLTALGFQPATGIRMTAAAVTPMAVGQAIGLPEAGVLVGVGGLFVSFLDSGGAYRQRARTMLTAAVAIALSGAFGVLAASHGVWAGITLFCMAFATGLCGAFGAVAESTSLFVLIAFIVSQNSPGGWNDAMLRFAGLGAGGVWATLVSLILWPLRPYGPQLDAVAGGYRSLAALFQTRLGTDPASLAERRAVENALAQARERTLENRASRQGISPIGQNLLVLIRQCDLLYAAGISLDTAASIAEHRGSVTAYRRPLRALVLTVSRAAGQLAAAISAGGGPGVDRSRFDRALNRFCRRAAAGNDETRAVLRGVQRIATLLNTAIQACTALKQPASERAGEMDPPVPESGDWREKLAALWTLDSLILRHALRLAVTATLGLWIAWAWRLHRGAWVPLTVAIILKPDFGGTRDKALGRVAGTMLGGVIAAVLDFYLGNPWLNVAALVPLGILAFSQKAVAYQRFVLFLTVFVLVMLNLVDHGDWRDPLFRIVDTAIAGALALLTAQLFFPKSGIDEFPARIGDALQAIRTYLGGVLLRFRGGDPGPLRNQRLNAQLAAANLAVDFQRFLSENRERAEAEPVYSLVNSVQRLADDTITLAQYTPDKPDEQALSQILRFDEETGNLLRDLEIAARNRALPPAAPDFEGALDRLQGSLTPARNAATLIVEEMQGIRNALVRLEKAHRSGSNLLA
ncbi:MAG: FUSC family protein [Bryobacteraceae bacterium]|nr:FUSC family protein [Bryobacteraceae bacterium]